MAIAPLRNCFSLTKVHLSDYSKCCFPVVTIFTSTLLTEFSINLPNIALFLNLEYSFLDFVAFFSFSFHKSVLRLIYGLKIFLV